MRAARFFAIVIAAVLLHATPALAKVDVRAELDGSVRLGAAQGATIPVRWRLVDSNGRAFGASGVHLRVSRCGGGFRRFRARNLGGGRFSARVVVPRAGIRMLRVGLADWRTPGGKTVRVDMLIGFDPPLVRRCG